MTLIGGSERPGRVGFPCAEFAPSEVVMNEPRKELAVPRPLLFLIASLFSGAAAFADTSPEDWKVSLAASFSGETIEACLDASRDATTCIGQQAAACMNTDTDVPADYVESLCTEIELDWWDTRLNANYQSLMALNETFDSKYGNPPDDPENSLTGTYRAAQRAWLPFRDRTCDHARISTGASDGPAADSLYLTCLLTLTATRALEMEDILSLHEG